MRMIKRFVYLIMVSTVPLYSSYAQLVDKNATTETVNLYKNLKVLLDKGVMFGHEDALAYGVNWKDKKRKSDVSDVVNDFPAVFGWDLGKLERDQVNNIDGVPFLKMKEYIKWVYDKGGINTISWHLDNPVTYGNAWDTTRAVASILPGGESHESYKLWLNKVAFFLKSLKGRDGKMIPILWRPYHELGGNWFWWGQQACTKEEYIKLWKFTVDYFRNEMNIRNLIYVYSYSHNFSTVDEFLERYPGDDYVDMMGFDIYCRSKPKATADEIYTDVNLFKTKLQETLSVLDSASTAHKKIPALTEVGYEGIPYNNWWTDILLDAMSKHPVSYVLLWRNKGWMEEKSKFHYFAPYPGHPSAEDFKMFYNSEQTLFKSDIKKYHIYKKHN